MSGPLGGSLADLEQTLSRRRIALAAAATSWQDAVHLRLTREELDPLGAGDDRFRAATVSLNATLAAAAAALLD